MKANKIPKEKTRWELYKNTECCLEQILEVKPYKIAAVQTPAFHLTKQPRQTRHGACSPAF